MRNNHAAIFRRSLLRMFAAVLLSACLFGGCSTEDAAIVRQGMPLAELKEAADKIGFPCVVKPLMSSSGKGSRW